MIIIYQFVRNIGKRRQYSPFYQGENFIMFFFNAFKLTSKIFQTFKSFVIGDPVLDKILKVDVIAVIMMWVP